MTLIQKGNAKLIASDTMMFNLPAGKITCGRACAGCYALKEERIYPTVLPARMKRLEGSKAHDFVDNVSTELRKLKKRPKLFRVHASGDFYSQSYVDKWVLIANENPDIIFYAYTKRMKKFNFTQLDSLPNFVLTNSLHFKGINYGKKDEAPSGAFICPDQKGADVSCGLNCTWCMTKGCADKKGVWFVKH